MISCSQETDQGWRGDKHEEILYLDKLPFESGGSYIHSLGTDGVYCVYLSQKCLQVTIVDGISIRSYVKPFMLPPAHVDLGAFNWE